MSVRRGAKGYGFRLYRKLADESYTISLILRFNKRRYIYSLPFTAYPEQWDEVRERFIDNDIAKEIIKERNLEGNDKRNLMRSIHPEGTVNNLFLDNKSKEIREAIEDFERRKVPFTNEMVIERLFVTAKASYAETYLLCHIEKLKGEKRFNTARTFEELHVCLQKYDPKFSKRLIPEISYDYVNSYYTHYINEGRKASGIGVNLRALRTLLNEAIKENVGSPETYPFSNQYATRTGKNTFSIANISKEATRKRNIPAKYLKIFLEYEFESISHMRCKGIFFFSFFCGGINFVDMSKLKKSDIKTAFNKEGQTIKYFNYVRSKTKEPIEIQLNEDIQAQIDFLSQPHVNTAVEDYLLPIVTTEGLSPEELHQHRRNKIKRVNKYLKEMAEIMGFPEGLQDLSTYFARHSFAMQLYNKTGSIDMVSAALHHADTEITKVYLESFGADEIAEISRGLLS